MIEPSKVKESFKRIREEKQEGMDLIEIYKNKYPRHTAFKSEVTQAFQASGLFDGRVSRRGVR